tara:strand:+ start:1505 stop:2539 length:1035 start_codon:yes stop_codon:yes gene_type:complete
MPKILKNRIPEMKAIISKNGIWNKFINSLDSKHFSTPESLSFKEKTLLFKKSVDLVEIEPHSYCNRICPFCPNYFLDRRKTNNHFDINIFDKIISDLALISYDQVLRFALYSEPLASSKIIKLITTVKKMVPMCEIDTITNGDYLDKSMLDNLINAGLNTLWISIYPKDYLWVEDEVHKRVNKISSRIKINPKIKYKSDSEITWVFPNKNINITANAKELNKLGYDRGGSLNKLTDNNYFRDSPCRMVFSQFTVYSDGSVVPCCNIRNDYAEHNHYIIDKLDGKKSIFDVYCSNSMAEWRKNLVEVSPKKGVCESCKQHISNSKIAKRYLEMRINKKLFDINSN